jgi:AraC-like DNA-binding protein
LQQIFKKETGITLLDCRNAERLKKAKLLLKGCDDKIIDISAACGFEDSSYFTKIFTREVGISPTEYRKLKF